MSGAGRRRGRPSFAPALAGPAGLALLMALAVGLEAAAPDPRGAGRPVGQAEPPLFASHEPLAVTLTADLEALRDDRSESPDRPGTLRVATARAGTALLDVEVRTRGEFRLDRANCFFPPLRLEVVGDARGTVFEGQDDLKLVSSCRPGRATYDRLVPIEYLAYRAYALVTERALRVRALRLTLVDANGAAPPETRYAFVIEEDEALAARLAARVFELDEGENLPASAFDPVTMLTTAVFEYMIGNTDWSDVAGHNVEILDRGGVALAVPYDFDFSGLVDAPYATADPDFGLRSVRERYYRGWCANPVATAAVLDRFRAAEEEILDLFGSDPELDDDTRARALRYLRDFFDDIETDERAERRFLRDCRTPGA